MNRLSAIAIIIIPLYSWPQEKIVPIKYGDMDQWETVRFMNPILLEANISFFMK